LASCQTTIEEDPMAFNPYLFFTGTCREAFNRYHEIFGGDLVLLTMNDVPAGEEPPPAEMGDMIIHAALKVGNDLLMASDDPTTDTPSPKEGIMVSYNCADAAEAKRVFDALVDGGEVRQALQETFFSPAFGMCVDRFGIPWMVTTDQQG
jgi:PhnB protein